MALLTLLHRVRAPWSQLWRKNAVFIRRMTLKKLFNLALRSAAFVFRSPGLPGVPVLLKVDVAPQCQLRCKVCQHSSAGVDPDFHAPAIMRTEVFEKIVNEVAGKTIAMALYNLGEPLLNPRLGQMIRYAEERGINTYFTTNLSLPLKDERIKEIIDSGCSTIIVAVDGVSEGIYGQQRVGGNWNLVGENIRRLGAYKAGSGRRWPRLVLQYLSFDFNAHERDVAKKFATDAGFDIQFIQGQTTPWKQAYGLRSGVEQKPAGVLPHCAWPYFSMVVNSSGQVSACCTSRMDDYHLRSAMPRSMGNVAAEGVSAVYRNAAYRSSRRLSANPKRHGGEAPGHFCEGCRHLAKA